MKVNDAIFSSVLGLKLSCSVAIVCRSESDHDVSASVHDPLIISFDLRYPNDERKSRSKTLFTYGVKPRQRGRGLHSYQGAPNQDHLHKTKYYYYHSCAAVVSIFHQSGSKESTPGRFESPKKRKKYQSPRLVVNINVDGSHSSIKSCKVILHS